MIRRNAVRASQLAALLLTCGSLACIPELTSPGPGEPPELDPSADLTVLFIGNSLTESNDLPSMVRAVAAAGGRTISYAVSVASNVSLEDHWYAGAANLITTLAADVVVLQQGPSSLPESQQHLRQWAMQLAGPITAAGGTPALFMVWPDASRLFAFDAVYASYRGAAEAVGGMFIPAGDAWRAVWRRDPDAALYSGDDFHPSRLGSLVAALTIYAVLFDADVRTLPNSIASDVPAEQFEMILAAVHEAVVDSRTAEP